MARRPSLRSLRHIYEKPVDLIWASVLLVSACVTLITWFGTIRIHRHRPLLPSGSWLNTVDADLTHVAAVVAVLSFGVVTYRFVVRWRDDAAVQRWLKERSLSRLLLQFHRHGTRAEGDDTFRYTPARRSDLPLFSAWSDVDATIGALRLDRPALYDRWFAIEPACFWLLWQDVADGGSEPLGCTIILPLTELGARVLRASGQSAIDLGPGDLVPYDASGARERLVIDTWLRNPNRPRDQEPSFERMARLLYRHLRAFGSATPATEIWFEPDHRVLKRLGALRGVIEDCGRAATPSSRTYRFNLARALEVLEPRQKHEILSSAGPV